MIYYTEDEFMEGFEDPQTEYKHQWLIWDNYRYHQDLWGGMEHDPHDHSDALYEIPYVKAGLAWFQSQVPSSAVSILEIGCAQGYILNHVGAPDADRTGIDFNEDRVRKGKEQYPNTLFIVGDIRSMQWNRTYDVVLLPGILEHMRFSEARLLLQKAYDLCTPGGVILFDLPFWSGELVDFNSGIHMNPTHAWVGTEYRWQWLTRGMAVTRTEIPEYPFYAYGAIHKPTEAERGGILVGCWGKIGDIIHAMPTAQKLARDTGEPVWVVHDAAYAAVDSVLDLLDGIAGHFVDSLDWTAPDLGLKGGWNRIVNCSHNGGRQDPIKGWTIFDWWADGKHAVDFAAANAGLTLEGSDRLLRFKPHTVRRLKGDNVVFLSNTGDPPMRGVSEEWLAPVVERVRALGGYPIECSSGPICAGDDQRQLDLGQVVKLMVQARFVVSVDTLASGLLAQSLHVPMIRIYRATRESMTGAVLPSKTFHHVKDAGHNQPPDVNQVLKYVEELWKK